MGTTTSFIRGHIGAAIASGVAVVALAGGGIAYAVTASGSPAPAPASASRPSASTPTTTAPHGARGAGGAGQARSKHSGVRGTVATVNGGTWTVKTAKGATISVTVTPQTAFGTKKVPASASSFPVGTMVRVEGKRAGTSITAVRIVAPKPGSGATTSTTVAS